MTSSDAIVIGGGPNGLAVAFRLAKAGRRVVVVDPMATPPPLAQGFPAPPVPHLSWNLDPRVVAGMDLHGHGLAWANANLSTTALTATGDHLRMDGPVGLRLSGAAKDRAAWEALRSRMLRFAAVLAPLRQMAPPRLAQGVGNPVLKLAGIALKARLMGTSDFRELLRVFLTNMHDALNDELSDPPLKGALAFDASLGAWLGPRSPNSLILWLDRLAGQVEGVQGAVGLPRGGMAGLAQAMHAAAVAAGVTFREGTVGQITVEGRASGLTLTDGTALSAPLVVSAIPPQDTLLRLVGPRHLDTGLVTRLRHLKARGGAAKLHLALSGAPDFRGADLRTRLVIASSEVAVEEAFNPAKYGEVPEAPVMEIVLPSAFEPGHAPEGRHLLSAIVQFAPHSPPDREAARSALLAACLRVLETHAPGIGRLVVAADLRMPWEMPQWHHAELSVEQMLFLRPLPGTAQYASPITGLWLASAGTHPGGGVSGTPGWNAADAIVKAGA